MRVDREESLDVALGQIERQFGKGSVMRMNDAAHVSTGAISTGSLTLDLALGVGGLPRGRIVEIFGPESSGKTTLVYHVIAEAQRRGGICAFIDAEHAMDPQYARRIGVNIDELLVSQPDNGEQALEIAELLIRSGALDVVAVDSVAALTPKAEIEGEMGDSHVGLQARLMSQALRKLAGTLNRTDTICLFTNQLREKIGVMFGSPETTPGGRALKFYSSVRLDIRRIETLKEGVEAIGNRVRVKVVKNKVAPPFKQAEFDIIYGSGISWEGTVLEAGIDRKVVQKSGSYFSFDEERLGQGRQNAAAFLREHPDAAEKIVQRIQAELGEGAHRLRAAASDRGRGERRRRQGGGRGCRRRGLRQELARSPLRSRGRVEVALDGESWRTLPAEVVLAGRARRRRRARPGARPPGAARAEATRGDGAGGPRAPEPRSLGRRARCAPGSRQGRARGPGGDDRAADRCGRGRRRAIRTIPCAGPRRPRRRRLPDPARPRGARHRRGGGRSGDRVARAGGTSAPPGSAPGEERGRRRPAIWRARASRTTRSRARARRPLQSTTLRLYDERTTTRRFACTRAVSE